MTGLRATCTILLAAAVLAGRMPAAGGEPAPPKETPSKAAEPAAKPPAAETATPPGAADAPAKIPEAGRYVRISKRELQEMLRQGSVTLIDVNDRRRYKISHIEGATNVDYDEIAKAAEENRLPKDRNAPLVFYCLNSHCPASRYAALEAIRRNYRNVYVYVDGIEGWERWDGLQSAETAKPTEAAPANGKPAPAAEPGPGTKQ